MATIRIGVSSFIIILTLFTTLSASMATVSSSTKFPTLVSSSRSTPKLPHYYALKLIRPLVADTDLWSHFVSRVTPQDVSNGVAPVTDTTWNSLVLRSETLVLVLFMAEWHYLSCSMVPIMDAVANGYSGEVEFYILNIDENPFTPFEYVIRSIPTILFFKNGEVKYTIVGPVSMSQLSECIDENL